MRVARAERKNKKFEVICNGETVNKQADEALRSAVGAVALLGEAKASSLLEMPDERVGHLFKQGLERVLLLLASADENLICKWSSYPVARRAASKNSQVAETSLDLASFEARGQAAREALVTSKQVLPAQVMWARLGVTRQALNKTLTSGRMFTVDVGAKQYYPAFYLSATIDRKALAKVTQALGTLPGWSKWQFFSTSKGSLGEVTPLEALQDGRLKEVLAAAEAFSSR